MPEASLNSKITKGILWKGLERIGSRGVTFVVAIILARLLAPYQFGTISMLLVFVEFAGVFVDSGFPLALVQKKDADQLDFNTVFFANLAIACIGYCVLFFCAPWVADFYDDISYVNYLRAMALSLPISSLTMVHDAFLVRQMKFHLIFRARMLGNLVSGTIGCGMALCGCGIWALIAQYVMCAVVTCLCFVVCSGWRPQWQFSLKRLAELFSYGWKVAAGFLLNTVYNEAYTLIIGKIYSKETLAHYKRGNSFPHMGITTISNTISSVFLPALSSIQDNEKDIRQLVSQGIKTSMYFVTPMLLCLLVVAEPLVLVLLTEKWLPCVVFLQLTCLTFLFQPMNDINRQVILARGHSGKILFLEIILKIQLVAIILLTFHYGVLVMVWGLVAQAPVMFVETAWANGKLANYPWWHQLRDISPILCLSALTAGITFATIKWMPYSSFFRLVLGCVVFAIFYLASSYQFHIMPAKVRALISVRFNRTTSAS